MKYDSPEPMTKENRLQLEMASWIYQSHLWKKAGSADDNIICEWCGKSLRASVAISELDDLCPGNPKVQDMRRNWVKHMSEGMAKANTRIKESREGICQES